MKNFLKDPLNKKREFFAINALRFIAASWVLFFHISIHFGSIDELFWIQPVINKGTLAMTLFFMLSGFILSYRYSTFFKPDDIPNYFAARVARIYPVYIFMGLTTIWQLGYGAGQFWIIDMYGYLGAVPFALFVIFLFVFAAQAWFPGLFSIWNFNGSWSLSVEAFFYTFFPRFRNYISSLGDRSLTVSIFLLSFIICCISIGLLISHKPENSTAQIFYILPIFRLPEFLLGICGYIFFVERGLFRRTLFVVGGIFSFLLFLSFYWHGMPPEIKLNFPASITFLAFFVFCLKVNAGKFVKRFCNYLGRLSYCVYMAQFSTIPLIKKFSATLSIEQIWAVIIVSTYIFAALTYHFIEMTCYIKTKEIAARLYIKVQSKFLKVR